MFKKEEINIATDLFKTNFKAVRTWNVEVGKGAAKGVCSNLNPHGTGARTSRIAQALDKIFFKEISISNVLNNPTSYIEYFSRNGETIQCLVSCYGTSGITISTNTENLHFVLTAIFTALMYNKEFAKEMCTYGDANGMQSTKAYEEIVNLFASGKNMTKDDMQIICDAFYYGFAKTYCIAEIDDSFSSTLVRMNNTNQLLAFEPELAPPKLMSIGASTKTASTKPAKVTPFTMPLLDIFDEIKSGKYVVDFKKLGIDFEWNDVQKKYIKPLSYLNSFIPTETFRKTFFAIYYRILKVAERYKKGLPYEESIGRTAINIKVVGKPGTGKTAMIQAILCGLGFPVGIINCKGRMEEDEIEGMNKFIAGKVYSVPTKAGELFGFGGAIVLEEGNLPDSDILQGALGQALEYPYILNVDGYKPYIRHPFTIFFTTMNIGTDGTKKMNQAFSSRFSMTVKLEDVPEDEFVNILAATGYSKRNCKKVLRAYMAVLDYLRQFNEELVMSVTMRHCLCCLELMDIGFDIEDAIDQTFINEIYSRDMDVAEDVRGVIMKAI